MNSNKEQYHSTLWVTDSMGGITFTLHLTRADLVRVKLDPVDRMLLNDVEHGEPSNTPLADKLLGLETVVRRIEEQL